MTINMSEFMNTNATLAEESKREKTTSASAKTKQDDAIQAVHLSSHIQSIQQQIVQASVVDLQKVDSIKAKIAENKFDINAEKIADKILKLEKDLFGK